MKYIKQLLIFQNETNSSNNVDLYILFPVGKIHYPMVTKFLFKGLFLGYKNNPINYAIQNENWFFLENNNNFKY